MKPTIACVLTWAFVLTSSVAQADIITVPTGLNPGDQYYLAFITPGSRDATSIFIEDYDSFVNAQADLSINPAVGDITWLALGSTSYHNVSAKDHLNLDNHPIYLLDGSTIIADNSDDLWDGTLDATLSFGSDGGFYPMSEVWTGTRPDGAVSMYPLGMGPTIVGSTEKGTSWWVEWYPGDANQHRQMYAFSTLQTVPTVPEPASLAVWVVFAGCAVVFGMRRRQRLHTLGVR